MSPSPSDSIACRQGAHAALVTLFGIVTSGPLGVLMACFVLTLPWRPSIFQTAADCFLRSPRVSSGRHYNLSLVEP